MTRNTITALFIATTGLLATPLSAQNATAAHDIRRDGRVSGLSGWTGSAAYFRVYVPSGADALTLRTVGGQGDVDMYLRKASWPTRASYQYRSVGKATDERIQVNSPTSGWWHVMLHAYRGYAGVTLDVRTGDDIGNDGQHGVITLRNGSTVRNIIGHRGSDRRFRIVVPGGTEELTIRTTGGTGDADLYLRRGGAATTANYHYRSVGKYTREEIRVANPPAGTWYVLLSGYRNFANVTLTASLQEGDGRGWGDQGDWDWGHDDDDDDHVAARWIRITEPDPREQWRIGQRVSIRWNAGSAVDRVWVYYSLDDGRNWTRLGNRSVDADDGRLTITLPDNERFVTRTARIRVVDADRPAIRATSGRFGVLNSHDDDDRNRPRPRGDRYEPNGNLLQATTLRVGQSQTHTINPAGDHDWFMIPATLPGRYTINILGTTTELRAKAYENDGRTNRAAGSFKDLRTGGSITLTATGRTKYFLVRIYGEERNDRGTYRLTVTALRRGNVGGGNNGGNNTGRPRQPRPRPSADVTLNVTRNYRIDEDFRAIRFVPEGNGAYAFRLQTNEDLEAELYIDHGRGLQRVRRMDLDNGTHNVGFLARRNVTRAAVLKLRTEDDDDTASVKVKVTRIGRR
ncbi:MAG: PPC domain-containing protein [Phycisphaerae bacterium]